MIPPPSLEAEDPRRRKDSIVGIKTECVIVDLYATDGQVLAIPTDAYIAERSREQCVEYGRYLMQRKKEIDVLTGKSHPRK